MTSREVGGVRLKLLSLHWVWVPQSPNKTEEKQTKVCCLKAMASISDVLLIVNLFLSASVFGFPLHQDIKQTCGYEVGVPCCVLLMCFDRGVTKWTMYACSHDVCWFVRDFNLDLLVFDWLLMQILMLLHPFMIVSDLIEPVVFRLWHLYFICFCASCA